MSTTSPVLTAAKELLYQTDIHYPKSVVLHGPILDLLNAQACIEDTQKNIVWAWINGAAAFFTLGVSSLVHLVHDFVMMALHAIGWAFSNEAKNTCKVHAYRCAMDAAFVLAGAVGTVYPKASSHLISWAFSQMRDKDQREVVRVIGKVTDEVRDQRGITDLKNTFFKA